MAERRSMWGKAQRGGQDDGVGLERCPDGDQYQGRALPRSGYAALPGWACRCGEQVAGERGGLVADFRDGRGLVPASAQWRAQGEDVGGGPAGRVTHGAAGVGVQSQPQRVGPGQAGVKQVAQERIGGGGDVGGGPGAVDEPAGGQLGGGAAVVDADPHAAALAAGRGDVAVVHRQPSGRGERGGPAGGFGRHPVAVRLPVAGEAAQEQPLVLLGQLCPQAGDLRPQRVHDILPVTGVGGGAGPRQRTAGELPRLVITREGQGAATRTCRTWPTPISRRGAVETCPRQGDPGGSGLEVP
jgi:hypothetical protein